MTKSRDPAQIILKYLDENPPENSVDIETMPISFVRKELAGLGLNDNLPPELVNLRPSRSKAQIDPENASTQEVLTELNELGLGSQARLGPALEAIGLTSSPNGTEERARNHDITGAARKPHASRSYATKDIARASIAAAFACFIVFQYLSLITQLSALENLVLTDSERQDRKIAEAQEAIIDAVHDASQETKNTVIKQNNETQLNLSKLLQSMLFTPTSVSSAKIPGGEVFVSAAPQPKQVIHSNGFDTKWERATSSLNVAALNSANPPKTR